MTDTIRKIAEDAFSLAAAVRTGADLGEVRHGDDELDRAARQWRLVERIVEIGDRIVAVAGVPSVPVPPPVRDIAGSGR